MVGSTSERTFSGAIIPPGISHIYKLVSLLFPSQDQMIEFAGLSFSLPMDFYVKILGIVDMTPGKISTFPLGIDNKFKTALFARTLLLNCLTKQYADLWLEMWKDEYKQETWSIEDKRLKSFASLTEQWQRATPLPKS